MKTIKYLPILFIALLLSACSQQGIRTYTVKKEAKPAMTMPAAAPNAGAGGAAAASNQMDYETPEGWSDIGGSGMRVAAFEAGPVSITVIPLPGSAGTLLSNVNRWRGQIGLDAVEEAALETTKVPMAGSEADLVELVGEEQAMTAAILRREGMQWFYKMMGPVEDVKAQRAAFDTFLNSVTFP